MVVVGGEWDLLLTVFNLLRLLLLLLLLLLFKRLAAFELTNNRNVSCRSWHFFRIFSL